ERQAEPRAHRPRDASRDPEVPSRKATGLRAAPKRHRALPDPSRRSGRARRRGRRAGRDRRASHDQTRRAAIAPALDRVRPDLVTGLLRLRQTRQNIAGHKGMAIVGMPPTPAAVLVLDIVETL